MMAVGRQIARSTEVVARRIRCPNCARPRCVMMILAVLETEITGVEAELNDEKEIAQ